MQAVVVREFGGPEALRVVEVPAPQPGPGQVLITVAASAVNPVDAFTRAGGFPDLAELGRDIGIGWDVAGVIAEVGPGVTDFAAGDAVIGMRDRLTLPTGAYAEQIALDAAHIAPAPRGIDLAAAATIPLNGLTAIQALDLLAAPAGSTVLITGAAGAVGGYLVELAVGRGLRVVATASASDEELVRELGRRGVHPAHARSGRCRAAPVPRRRRCRAGRGSARRARAGGGARRRGVHQLRRCGAAGTARYPGRVGLDP